MLEKTCRTAVIALLAWTPLAFAQAPYPATDGLSIDVDPPMTLFEAALEGPLPAEKLLLVDRAANRLVLMDPMERQMLARLPTGTAPREVAISPDGGKAYIANYGVAVERSPGGRHLRGEAPEASITVVDLETGSVLRTLRPFRTAAGAVLSVKYHLVHDIQIGADGRRLYLTAEADSSVLELDAETGEVLMEWKTGGGMSHTLVTSRDARKLYIANRSSDSVTVIDRLTVVAQRVPTGRQPEGLALSPSGRELWITNRGDHTLTVVDTRRLRRLATFDAGGRDPVRLAFRPKANEVWVAHRESRELTVFDARSREKVAEVAVDVAPHDLAFSADGTVLYVSAPGAGRVLVLDPGRRQLLDSFQTGGAPSGLVWSRPTPATALRP